MSGRRIANYHIHADAADEIADAIHVATSVIARRCTLRGMCSAEETRLIEVLVTHNEPVLCDDLACSLGIPRAAVQELAIRLQTLGYTVVDDDNDTVAATPAADKALHSGPG